MPFVICAGHAAYDIIFPMEYFPEENSKYLLRETIESPGGPACNAARLLGLWGASCAFAGRVGNDFHGRKILEGLESSGVDISLAKTSDKAPTPLSIVIANGAHATRTILTRKADCPPLALGSEKLKAFSEQARNGRQGSRKEASTLVLLFDGHEPDASLELIAAFPEALVILDGGGLRPGTELLARRADYALVSERFAVALLEREEGRTRETLSDSEDLHTALGLIRAMNGKWAAITLGERGCVFLDPDSGKAGAIPALSGQAVDTTAAGDVFHGAFAYGIARESSFIDSLRLATAAAGLSVRKRGGWDSVPEREEAEKASDYVSVIANL